jgi:SAM-dependent methyltransferase
MADLDSLIEGQRVYYGHRARDWDQWIRNYMRGTEAEFDEILAASPLDGDILEMACGTGYWTEKLSRIARHVTALDASSDMLDVLQSRGLANVAALRADLFSWNPPTQWDGVFFAHWLAHVPDERFEHFWQVVDAALLPGGHVVCVDVTPAEKRIEEEIVEDGAIPITRRRLKDGRRFDVVKKYWEPDELLARMSRLGWVGHYGLVGADRGLGFAYYDLERGR